MGKLTPREFMFYWIGICLGGTRVDMNLARDRIEIIAEKLDLSIDKLMDELNEAQENTLQAMTTKPHSRIEP